MGFLAVAAGYKKDKYLSGTKTVAISEVKMGAQPYTAQHCFGPGIEINPANGENLVISRMKGSSRYMVTIGGVNQDILPDTDRGERRIYSVSSDGATIKAIAKFKNDGVLELNGASSFAVKFEELETAFNTLKSEYNLHNHPTAPTGPVTPPSNAPSAADITPAKSADVKLS